MRGCEIPEEPIRNLAAMVRWYIKYKRPIAKEELDSFASEPSLRSAIERAGMATYPDGKRLKRYDHQRRIPKAALRKATARLRRLPLAKPRDFESLFQMIKDAIHPIDGIGELTVYDTALRIGAKRELLPTRVYLHAGTRIGARPLALNWRAKTLEVKDCPPELHELKPYEIEDFFCMFAHGFAPIAEAR